MSSSHFITRAASKANPGLVASPVVPAPLASSISYSDVVRGVSPTAGRPGLSPPVTRPSSSPNVLSASSRALFRSAADVPLVRANKSKKQRLDPIVPTANLTTITLPPLMDVDIPSITGQPPANQEIPIAPMVSTVPSIGSMVHSNPIVPSQPLLSTNSLLPTGPRASTATLSIRNSPTTSQPGTQAVIQPTNSTFIHPSQTNPPAYFPSPSQPVARSNSVVVSSALSSFSNLMPVVRSQPPPLVHPITINQEHPFDAFARGLNRDDRTELAPPPPRLRGMDLILERERLRSLALAKELPMLHHWRIRDSNDWLDIFRTSDLRTLRAVMESSLGLSILEGVRQVKAKGFQEAFMSEPVRQLLAELVVIHPDISDVSETSNVKMPGNSVAPPVSQDTPLPFLPSEIPDRSEPCHGSYLNEISPPTIDIFNPDAKAWYETIYERQSNGEIIPALDLSFMIQFHRLLLAASKKPVAIAPAIPHPGPTSLLSSAMDIQLYHNLQAARDRAEGKSESEINQRHPLAMGAPLLDECGELMSYFCTRTEAEKRKESTAVARRLAHPDSRKKLVNSHLLMKIETLRSDYFANDDTRCVNEMVRQEKPSTESSGLPKKSILHLHRLQAVGDKTKWEFFLGTTAIVSNSFGLRHFLDHKRDLLRLSGVRESVTNFLDLVALVFGEQVSTAMRPPIVNLLDAATRQDFLLNEPLYFVWLIDTNIREFWRTLRREHFVQLSTGPVLVPLSNMRWIPLWVNLFAEYLHSPATITWFKANMKKTILNLVEDSTEASPSHQQHASSVRSDRGDSRQPSVPIVTVSPSERRAPASRPSAPYKDRVPCLVQLAFALRLKDFKSCPHGLGCRFLHGFHLTLRSSLLQAVKDTKHSFWSIPANRITMEKALQTSHLGRLPKSD